MAIPSPERLTVARELHDGIAQDLVGIGYSLDLLMAEPSLDTSARMQIRRTRLEVDSLIAKVRREILNLRTPSRHH
jgi:signal transduction histidine kinase